MTKKKITVREKIMSKYESRSYADMVQMMKQGMKLLSAEERKTVRFEMDTYYERYDPDAYVALFIDYERLETDEEEAKREREERDRKKILEDNERRQYEALAKKYGAKK